jgi:peroxiredoxin
MLRSLLISCVLAVVCLKQQISFGQETYNLVLKIGDVAPAWVDLPGTDDKKHSSTRLKDKDVVVVVFTCLSCPTASDYEGRINDLAKKYAGDEAKVAIVPIVVNPQKADQLPALKQRVEDKGYVFHYLYDETQKIAKEFGAVYTPEFYVLDKDRKVVYFGALDDATDASKATRNYVQEAIDAALAGKEPEMKIVIARGCLVKYARERRRPE